jgi:hypothetical protein
MPNTQTANLKNISLTDLIDPATFEAWVRKHINIYNEKEIPVNHLTSFVEYIEKEVESTEFQHDRSAWFDTLTKLKDSISKNDNFKKRHSEDTEEVS